MNNFGVIELAGAKTTSAPGWAYIPDTRVPTQPQQAANRKRARTAPGGNLSIEALAARQESKTRKEVEALDRDWSRDNSIPIPPRASGGGGSGNTTVVPKKSTPNVRKILQSAKTFANHLDDYIALQALAEQQPVPKRSKTTKDDAGEEESSTTKIPTYTLFTQSFRPPPVAHPGDMDPLLVSRVPPMPTDEEMGRLLNRAPLSYSEAVSSVDDPKYPVRVFCEVCGYWGRVRCMKCGTRVCALDCLDTHREECVTRYGI